MANSNTVWMNRSAKSRVYHTDRGCVYLPGDPERVRSVAECAVEPHYDECKLCAGMMRHANDCGAYGDHYRLADEADPEGSGSA